MTAPSEPAMPSGVVDCCASDGMANSTANPTITKGLHIEFLSGGWLLVGEQGPEFIELGGASNPTLNLVENPICSTGQLSFQGRELFGESPGAVVFAKIRVACPRIPATVAIGFNS